MAVDSDQRILFKDFELNLRTRELYKQGLRVRLHGQPINVLSILVQFPGELISREALKKTLWPEDMFVDFEHSLNSAINRLREALGDHPDKPEFIETLPRLGYRFIAPVYAPMPPGSASAEIAEAPMPETLVIPEPEPEEEKRQRRAAAISPKHISPRRRWAIAGTVGAVALLVIALGIFRRPLPPPHITALNQITFGGLDKEVAGTDGSSLFLNLWDLRAIARMPASGGPITPIPASLPGLGSSEGSPPGQVPWLLDISPEGSRLLVLDRGDSRASELWVVGVSGNPAHYLIKATDAAWAPNGNDVVYATAQGEIGSIPAEGGQGKLLVATKAVNGTYKPVRDLRFSPDGGRIRFTQGHEIWEMASNGSNLHRVLPGWRSSSWQCCGRWTANGDFFVFLAGEALLKGLLLLPGGQIWALDERRGHLRPPLPSPIPLTKGPHYWGAPVPARNGRQIFARGVSLRAELVRYDRQSRRVEPYLNGMSAESVDFSPDGKSFAYVSYPDGILWKVNRDGTGLVQLTNPPFYPKLIRWSPDGTQILFTDYSPAGLETAYVVSPTGGTPMQVLPEDNGPQQGANWSPDGKQVVFSSTSDTAAAQAIGDDIQILELATHKITAIPGSDGMSSPRWSPDGRYITALTLGGANLKVFDLESHSWTSQNTGGYPQFPVWAHDSQSIYFVRHQDHGLFRVSMGDQRVEQVAELKDFRHAGWYWLWLGLDPGDAPLLLRDLGRNEIYQLTLE